MNPFDLEIRRKSNRSRKALLVGVQRPQDYAAYLQPLSELENLTQTVGIPVVGKIVQKRPQIHPGTYVGHGKLEEVKAMADELGATTIICDDDLSPSQAKKMEDLLEKMVIDRTEIILNIFAMHAQTKEAKLQVEVAQLEYTLPRLKRMWTHLESAGFRGPGEQQIETDRQIIKKHIQTCKEDLKRIQQHKEREVATRKQRFFTIGLVGYTNAGKSSIMNALTDAGVLVEDRLFSTLDTRTRIWEISQGRKAMLSDTVGFIHKLPHRLIASFKATLEEASRSDLLFHVVDVSHPSADHHINVVEQVLNEIGITDPQMLMVFNKIDMLQDTADLELLKRKFPHHVCVSAKKGHNLDVLKEKTLQIIEANMIEIDVSVSVTAGRLLSWITESFRILEEKLEQEKIHYKLQLSKENARWLLEQPGVEARDGRTK